MNEDFLLSEFAEDGKIYILNKKTMDDIKASLGVRKEFQGEMKKETCTEAFDWSIYKHNYNYIVGIDFGTYRKPVKKYWMEVIIDWIWEKHLDIKQEMRMLGFK